MSKVEGGGGPIDPPVLSRLRVTIFSRRLLGLTIIPQTRIRCELLDSERGAEHVVGYHRFISNKCKYNCFIKYQTVNKSISNCIEVIRELSIQLALSFAVSFHIWTNYRI